MAQQDATQRLLQQIRTQRQSWVELAPGKRVRITRPPESALLDFVAPGDTGHLVAELRHVVQYVDEWEGITEADMLGASIASEVPVPFSRTLWAELVADRRAWLRQVAQALLKAINDHELAKDAAEKN